MIEVIIDAHHRHVHTVDFISQFVITVLAFQAQTLW